MWQWGLLVPPEMCCPSSPFCRRMQTYSCCSPLGHLWALHRACGLQQSTNLYWDPSMICAWLNSPSSSIMPPLMLLPDPILLSLSSLSRSLRKASKMSRSMGTLPTHLQWRICMPRSHENPPSKCWCKPEANLCLLLAVLFLPAGLVRLFLLLTFSYFFLILQAERDNLWKFG